VKSASLAALAALAACVAAQSASAQVRVVSLPWPPTVLPRTPPLAPAGSGLMPLDPRFLGKLTNRERVVVGLDPDGTPNSIRVFQTIRIDPLGDYVFTIPAPVRTVTPGPGTESEPGQRVNQILWQGFSPGNRVLAAWADLRVAESVDALPVEVRVEPTGRRTILTVTNVTGVSVPSFTADPEPVSLGQVLGRIRAAIKRNVFAEGLNIGVEGKTTPVPVRVAAPLDISGSARSAGSEVGFSGLLDGVRERELRVVLPGTSSPKIDLRVRTANVEDTVTSKQNPRRRLAETIRLELTYARKRQYDQFLASPDQTGPSSATYVFRTASRPVVATPAATGSRGDEDHTLGWIVLGLGLAAAVPLAAVVWAHS
jgi:hypothetical protein